MHATLGIVLSSTVLVATAAARGAIDEVTFVQVAKLTAADAEATYEFGTSLAIDGDRLIVGSSSDAAYIFERDAAASGVWRQVVKLTAPDGAPGAFFGFTVALSGDRALVGAPLGGYESTGSAYVFERDAGGPAAWGPVAKLVDPEGDPLSGFGGPIDLDGETAVVGADAADGPFGTSDGAVYVYERDAGGPNAWGQVAPLRAAIACDPRTDLTYCGWADGLFGSKISLNRDTMAVGTGEFWSSGYTYVFKRSGEGPDSAWQRVARLDHGLEPFDNQFGFTGVTADGGTVVVGASTDHDLDTHAGSAYVFERDPLGPRPWRQVTKLHADDGAVGDYYHLYFGRTAALDGDTLVVGATQIEAFYRGKAYVFRRNAGGPDGWGQVARLEPEELEPYDVFGCAVAVSANTVVVGAYGDDDRGDHAGAVYVFEAVRKEATAGSRERRGEEARGDGGDDVGGNGAPESHTRSSRVGSIPHSMLVSSDRQRAVAASSRELLPQGQFCFEFSAIIGGDFCDALELSLSGGTITGSWFNTDCEHTEVGVTGTLEGGRARVTCDAATDPCPEGFTWLWIIDAPFDGTMDMLQLDGLWNSWIDELHYTLKTGPCLFSSRDL